MMSSTTVSSVFVALLAFCTYSSADAAASAAASFGDRDLKKGGNKATGGARRMLKHTRTTLVSFGYDELTPAETMFFEDTWMAVFNEIGVARGATTGTGTTTDEKVRSFVVDEEIRNGDPHPTDRKLRGWFDIGATYETSCRLCGSDTDGRRYLAKADGEFLRAFEETLCDRLRDGPFISMRDIEDCRVVF
jgi:hypothetical protein